MKIRVKIPVKYTARNLVIRRWTALMTVASVAFVVLVYIGVLSLARGLESAFEASGDALNVIVLREGALAETTSYYTIQEGRDLATLPGIATGTDGAPLASGESVILQNFAREDGTMSNVSVRGVGPAAFELRPGLKIVEGRQFEPGRAELIVGKQLAGRFPDLRLGREVELGRLPFRVVGLFDAGDSSFDSEVWGAADDLNSAYQRAGFYSSVLLRTASETEADQLVARIEGDQRLKLNALREAQYYEQQTAQTATQFIILGNALAIIMAFGACFAAANTMYASVAGRTREIGTLRVLGFRRGRILGAFMLEAMVLGLIAGVIGIVLALPLNALTTGTTNFSTFSEISFALRTSPDVLITGLLLAVITGVIGGLPAAWRASRMQISEAIRSV